MTKQSEIKGIKSSNDDIANPDEFIPNGEYNPHNVRPWLLHDHGFCLCVVMASCLQDALDIAADQGKLDCYLIGEEGRADHPADDGISFLGDACRPFDIDGLGIIEIGIPPSKFAALWEKILREN